jgi:TetR/AcrR family transcriptional regulator
MDPNTHQTRKTATRRQILAAAVHEFAEGGYAGATMDKIARKAGVNKATIYYHIGDKQALYAAVLHDVFGRVAQSILENVGEAATPLEKLKAYFSTIERTIFEHPDIPRIMLREVASKGEHLPHIVISDFIQIFLKLSGILHEGERQGLFIKTSPFIVHFMTVGPYIFLKNLEGLIQRNQELARIQGLHPHTFEEMKTEIEKLLLNALHRKEEHGGSLT